MLKIGFKPYMEINYKHPRMDNPILCLLVEINFDDESMTLQPMWGEDYLKEDFIAFISHCEIPRKKMSAEIINGEKVVIKKIIPSYDGSIGRLNPYFNYEGVNNPSAS